MNNTMTKPYFIFTKYANSFSVHIQNLEQLSVEQIQNIQTFVEQRKGVFDFETYSFVIQKDWTIVSFYHYWNIVIWMLNVKRNYWHLKQM